MRCFRGSEHAQSMPHTVGAYFGSKHPGILCNACPAKAGSTVPLRLPIVLQILGVGNISKINNPIIRTVAVDVVNKPYRPSSVIMGKSYSMCPEQTLVQHQDSIALPVRTPCFPANVCTIRCPNSPREYAGAGVVAKGLPDSFRRRDRMSGAAFHSYSCGRLK